MKGKDPLEPIALDLARYELRRSGHRINIERIPMDLLILLARSGGRLMTRREIIDHLWGKNPWLDADRNLNTAIGKIRRALGDDPDQPRFIETAVGKGYRFIAPVRAVNEEPISFNCEKPGIVVFDSSSQPVTPELSQHVPELPKSLSPVLSQPVLAESKGDSGVALQAISMEQELAGVHKTRQSSERILKSCAWIAAGILFLSTAVRCWGILDRMGWISRVHDTPIWIKGDWLVGEYRLCQMRTKIVPEENKALDSLEKLPRLFCSEDANGLSDFHAATAAALIPNDPHVQLPNTIRFYSVTSTSLDRQFHVIPVRYFGRIDRSDKWVISWRCRRSGDSLTCKALD